MNVLHLTARRDSLGRRFFLCRCPCGNEREVREDVIKAGLAAEKCAACRRVTHGQHGSPEHKTWLGIIWRCTDPKNAKYCGRGIVVCQHWRGKGGFERFLADMGPKPGPGFSIERKDNDGPYSPDNCIWLELPKQALNRRTSHVIEIDGVRRCAAEWARMSGVASGTIRYRLKSGWSPRDAVFGQGRLHQPKNR